MNEEEIGMQIIKEITTEEYETIIFDYLTNNCVSLKDEDIKKIVDLKCEQFTNILKENQKYKEVIDKIRKICSNVPYDWSVCGIDVVHKIENILKEVE